MRKRGWRVGTLSEFLPEDSHLWGLNTNHGQIINLRLRHAGATNQFLRFEQVLDTLLHELCHIVHGPHDEIFHKLWDELRDEWTSLQIKGFTGEGFLGQGQKVGGRRIPVDEVRRQARVAAEQRAKVSKTQAPGKRLGGAAPKPGRGGIRETIARAALSRTKVTTSCGTGTKAGDKAAQRAAEDSRRNGFKTKAEMDDANSVAIAEAMQELMELDEERGIDIREQTPPSEGLTWSAEYGLQAAPPKGSMWPAPNPYGSHKINGRSGEPSSQGASQPRQSSSNGASKKPVSASVASTSNSRGRPVSRVVLEAEAKKKQLQSLKPASTLKSEDLMRSPSHQAPKKESWACLECTLVNEPNTTSCDVCEAPRPGFTPSHWLLDKLSGAYAPKPSPGPHKLRDCLPLIVFIRNRLKYALNGREVKAIVMQRLIKVDGKVRTDATYPAGYMDVISIEKTGENFRLVYDTKGRFTVHRITTEEAAYKLGKVKRVQLGKGGIPFLVTHDARTIRYPDPAIKVNDTVKIDLSTGKITDFIKFDTGTIAMATGGRNMGRVGVITHRERHDGGFNIVHIKDAVDNEFATRESNVFVIGREKPWISLPKGKGVKLSIAEERDRRRQATLAGH
ncbi:hypothetical protein FKW77_010707 [Venturia effusa]|uniref:WLM domain-containing protein n=1 Tax=Venturia effusa TaxID=50376 RepID=A0A517KY89_9PEZI|nr:hypothetical protein FKW77_010707 [Venturia effusa]